jgi:AcrR family transcriptional regulator
MTDPKSPAGSPFELPALSTAPWALARLPAGRHGLPREFIEANQRNRLMAAALDVFTERGYAVASIADVIKAAGVSRHTFYAHFADKEASFLGTYDEVVDWLAARAIGSCEGAADWAHGVVAVVGSLTTDLVADPRLPRFLGIEALGAGEGARARHQALIDRLAEAFRSGRSEDLSAPDRLPLLDRVLVAGAISVLVRRSERGQANRPDEVAAELAEVLLAPYLGPAAAHELAAALPDRAPATTPPPG